MRYKVTFKTGKYTAVFAKKYKPTKEAHLFYKTENEPHGDIFYDAALVDKVEEWPMTKQKMFNAILVGKSTKY